jgi:hypothetical protein
MSLKQKIEQKALNMLNRVDDERVLTIIEKGNVKRFLSYYVEDVVVLLDTAIAEIKGLEIWGALIWRSDVLCVLGDGKEATK